MFSNTFVLERYLNGSGALIEGCPASSAKIPRNRPAAVAVPRAVCAEGGSSVVGPRHRAR